MRTLVRFPFARLGRLIPLLGGLALCTALVGGCASSGSGGSSEPRPIAVSLNGYAAAPFQLVSESHTSRVDLYSAELDTASTKVLNDEVMIALVEHLEDLGFREYARPGHAPQADPRSNLSKSIQVVENGRSSWWPLTQSADVKELKGFQTAMQDFLQLYNVAQSWQSVDNTLGGDYFDRKKAGH